MNKRLGIDLDNTIIDYQESYEILAKNLGIHLEFYTKDSVKAYFLRSLRGNLAWREFQLKLYTIGLENARVSAGFEDLIQFSIERNFQLYIVSHKPKIVRYMDDLFDFRRCTQEWIDVNPIIHKNISSNNIFYCSSLAKKVKKISELNLDFFIDDLQDVFNHKQFPVKTTPIIFKPSVQDFKSAELYNQIALTNAV